MHTFTSKHRTQSARNGTSNCRLPHCSSCVSVVQSIIFSAAAVTSCGLQNQHPAAVHLARHEYLCPSGVGRDLGILYVHVRADGCVAAASCRLAMWRFLEATGRVGTSRCGDAQSRAGFCRSYHSKVPAPTHDMALLPHRTNGTGANRRAWIPGACGGGVGCCGPPCSRCCSGSFPHALDTRLAVPSSCCT